MRRLLPKLLALIAVFVVFAIAIAWYGVKVPPYVGDLTRLGGYSEHDYGWTEPQLRFDPPLYRAHVFDEPADVLIIGDSMSLHRRGEQTDPGTYWPNFLAARTGWRIAALHRNEWTMDQVLALPQYRRTPPRILILQFAERAVVALERTIATYAGSGDCILAPSGALAAPALDAEPLAVAPEAYARLQPSERGGIDFSRGANHLRQTVERMIAPGLSSVRSFELGRGGLFSSRRDRRLLVYRDDLLKIGMSEQRLNAQRCALTALRNAVQAAGSTHMMILVVPDKLTAYYAELSDPPMDYPDVFGVLSAGGTLELPRLDHAFARAADAGGIDLFMPNDSHPGATGQMLIADAVYRTLVDHGIVAPNGDFAAARHQHRADRQHAVEDGGGAERQ